MRTPNRRLCPRPVCVAAAMLAHLLLLALAAPTWAQSGPLVQWGQTSGDQAISAPAPSERFIAVSAGWYHNLALRADGSLVQWGRTSDGQGNDAPAASERFAAIAACGWHSLALRADGSLVQWGRTNEGQQNNAPAASERFIAISGGFSHSLALRADGSLVQWGSTSDGQANNAPAASERFIAISAGSAHNLALRADGSLVQWGNAQFNQLDMAPAASERFIAIAAGRLHSLALRADGSLVQWGRSSGGQLNNAPAPTERFIAIAAGDSHNLALRADGTLVQWGAVSNDQADGAPEAPARLVAISAGLYHGLALRGVPAATRLAFTYQGVLTGVPSGGAAADLRFSLWSSPSGGQQRGAAVTQRAVPLSPRGLFSAELDFGLLDPSTAPWLQIEVAPPGTDSFTALTPRQRLGAAPMATLAGTALGGDSRWSDIASGISYTGPGGTTINGVRLTHGAQGASWDLVVGGSANSFAGGFAVAEEGAARLTVRAGGNVGIGTTTPDALLSVNGSASKPGGGSWATFSDARLKHDITPLEGSLEKLLSLRGVSFVYDDPESINEFPGRRIGMVAQEVEGVFPDWVETGASGYKSLTFRGFEALAVEALRELKRENDTLRSENEAMRRMLEAQDHSLRRELEEVKASVADLQREQSR